MLMPPVTPQPISDKIASCIATLGPLGCLPKAPGTWGSLGAVIVAPWLFLPFSLLTRIVILLGILAVGQWAASRMERLLNRQDPGCVVVDELLGQWLTLLPFSMLGFWHLVAGFVLFRCFDILKPWPIRWAEQSIPGGLGVMLDDCVAAGYACVLLWAGLGLFA